MLTITLDRLSLRDGMCVLDLGCGRGRHLRALAGRGGLSAIGLDLSFEDAAAARASFEDAPDAQGWSVTLGDALRLPFKDASFDRIICSEVLEHLPDYESALGEVARVLKPDGELAVSVPRAWPEAICWRLSEDYHNTPGGHVRIFKERELRAAIEARGFALSGRHFAHGLHSPYWWLKCALWRRRDDHPVIRAYQRFLEWDIMKRPRLTRWMEAAANPIMGKSIALYFRRAPEAVA